MKTGHASLLSILADGERHSGEILADQLNISRAAVWKSIKRLESFGLEIEAERGKGYQLKRPVELLSAEKIQQSLPLEVAKTCREIDVLFKTDSTNSALFNRLSEQQIHGHAVFAEYQSQGRGRRDNQWLAPLGSGLMLSIGWRFNIAPQTLGLLSLFIGVAVARSLQSQDIKKVGLKWPNDIVVQGKKIAGILLELRGETNGPVDVVIGIGMNYELPEGLESQIKRPITDICTHTNEKISRNEFAAILLMNVFEILKKVEVSDCLELLEEWRRLDYFIEQQAKLILPNEEVEGILKGVDDQGLLLMSVAGNIKRFNAGEVSLRVSS
ncbi:MAG: bifunctional biotin--[acetyl-CoA-carboxylase] ligase/biotin operon repressor BirA [Gammaproteobacteria bacterium]|jgi:BirA family biotin operon repressor/biotin-[acetyl-CoA-carboxylase] ligase